MSSWEGHVAAWSQPPVDDVGYIPSTELLARTDAELQTVVDRMRATRYGGWRNHGNLWRDVLGLDTTTGKDVLDFGCGVGVEALEYALAGNRVSVADISVDNLRLAERVLQLHGDQIPDMRGAAMYWVLDEAPFIDAADASFDVFHCNGVLHHSRHPRQIMERAHAMLRPGGEARLMLYSDRGWRIATGTEPPRDVEQHPAFGQFVRYFDSVGDYADWYDQARIVARFGDLFTVTRFAYITPDGRYLAAVLARKETP